LDLLDECQALGTGIEPQGGGVDQVGPGLGQSPAVGVWTWGISASSTSHMLRDSAVVDAPVPADDIAELLDACMPASLPVMTQITVRASDELVHRVKEAAASQGRSMNDYVTAVLDAATNPDLAGDEASQVRERLARAGLLAPVGVRRPRPSSTAVAAARMAAGRGTQLSELVGRDRQ